MNASILEGVNNRIKVINAWPTTAVTLLTSSSKLRTPSPGKARLTIKKARHG
jgi:hypothetical protein